MNPKILFNNIIILKNSFTLISKYNFKFVNKLLFIGFVSSFFEFFSFIILPPLISLLINNKSIYDYSLFYSLDQNTKLIISNNIFLYILTILIIVSIIKLALNYFFYWKQAQFISLINNDISKRLFVNYVNKEYDYFLKNNSSKISASLNSDIDNVIQIINSSFIFIFEIFILTGTLISLFYLNFIITIIIFFFILISILGFNYIQKELFLNYSSKRYEFLNIKYKIINQAFRNIKDIKIFGIENFFSNRYIKVVESENLLKRKISFLLNMPRSYLELVVICTIALLFSYISYIDNFTNLIPIISLFILALFRALPSINRILNSLQHAQNLNISLNVISKEFKFDDNTQNNNFNIINFNNEIKIDNVSFSYNNMKTFILKNINLVIKKGTKIGIIGESGCGKSTFVDLLLYLIKPNVGSIYIDGINVKFSENAWRSKIGYVQQNILLFDTTILENIIIGTPIDKIDTNKIDKLIRIFNLFSIVDNPKGLNSFIGENGNNLSGGQRQRLAILRALYRDPELLILDEATSALDEENELSIIETIFSYNPLMTIIIVSHKISILEKCDSIYKIKNGSLYLS